jgi:predicted RNase H-like HicB family nuclease
MNLPNPAIAKHEISVTLMLEPQASGRFVASAVEFPAFRIEAATEAEAIAELQRSLSEHVAHRKVMPWVIAVPPIDGVIGKKPAWTEFVGIFENDADFAAIVDEMRAERESDDESEIDPAYYLEA